MAVVELKHEPDRIAVDVLERTLDQLMAGEIRTVCVVSILQDGTSSVGWGGPNTFHEKIGLLEALKYEMLHDCDRG